MAQQKDIEVKINGIEPMLAMLKDDALANKIGQGWAIIYLAFVKLRFVKFSRGGGDWPGLAQSTKDGRRGDGDKAAILRNTGLLFATLNAVGFIVLANTSGDLAVITIRLDMSHQYPDAKATVADIVNFHNEGGPRLPKRVIFPDPDAPTTSKMLEFGKKTIVGAFNERGK